MSCCHSLSLPILPLKNQKKGLIISRTMRFRLLSAHRMEGSVSRLERRTLTVGDLSTGPQELRNLAVKQLLLVTMCTPGGPYSRMGQIAVTELLSSLLARTALHNSPTFKIPLIRCQNSTRSRFASRVEFISKF